jgi:3-oxoacyl-[acyl-carrier-protein] synthase-3
MNLTDNTFVTISSVAHYFPPTVINNKYFENYLDTSNEWIVKRTGIHERRFALNGATSDLIIPAAKECLRRRNLRPRDIDCIIVCTVTPDYQFPNTAAVVQDKLGCRNAWGFDISAACSGFVFGLSTAASFVKSGLAKRVLLCGADKMTSVLNLNDRNQAVLFGDGAGVCIIEKSDLPNYGVIDQVLHIDGSGGQYLKKVAGGSFLPAWHSDVKPEDHYIHQEGQTVFKNAVTEMTNATFNLLRKQKLSNKDITWFIPHQANLRIVKSVGEKLGLPNEKVVVTIDKFANTTSATIPSAMSMLWEDRKLRKGDNIIIASFGAGFTWGASLIRWNPYEA